MQAISVDSNSQYIGPRNTYKVSGNISPAANALAFLAVTGIAGKVIRITKIKLSGLTLTAVQYLRVICDKNSTAFTGGTPTNPAKVPLDSGAPASTAVIQSFASAPGAGAIVGPLAEKTVIGQATAAAAAAPPAEVVFDFNDRDGITPAVIRGALESVSVRFGVAPATAVTLSYEIEYTEDGN
jgi:hypothetical protein